MNPYTKQIHISLFSTKDAGIRYGGGVKKFLLLILSLYILALVQTSFLVHFTIEGLVLNLILIAVIIINFFKSPNFYTKIGMGAAFFGGFFLDIFSESFIGFHILILLGLVIFIKFILRRYVRIPTIKRI